MRTATKSVARWLGVIAGIAGIEHGYFEILQGNTSPDGLVISSIGPPCLPDEIWNACEPAMTMIPNFLISGILSVLLGFMLIIGSVLFIQMKYAGWGMILLSILLLLTGGGFFPPLIGVIGGLAGIKINKPIVEKQPGRFMQSAARLWPWPLVIFMVWVWGQWIVGYFWNDFLQQNMIYGVILILVMLPLSVWSAYVSDLQSALKGEAYAINSEV
jgi:hypothetical protein